MQTPKNYGKIIITGLSISSFFYIVIVSLLVIIYCHTADGIGSNILYNMSNKSVWYYICTVFVSLMCVFSYPVAVMPALQLIEPKENKNDKGLFTKTPKKIIFRIAIVIGVSAVAMIFPQFNIVVSLYILFLLYTSYLI